MNCWRSDPQCAEDLELGCSDVDTGGHFCEPLSGSQDLGQGKSVGVTSSS